MSSESTSHRPPPLSNLTDAQRRAVLWEGGDVHVTGGPGSGKTAVVVRRVEHLITQNAAAPENVLLLVESPTAASALRASVGAVLPQRAKDVDVASIASTCARLLRHHGDRIGLSSFSIYTDHDAEGLVRSIMTDLGYGLDSAPPEDVWAEIARTKALGGSVASIPDPLYCGDERTDVFPAYQDALARAHALDRWDLAQETIRLFEDHEALLDRYRGQWRYILVDDGQNWSFTDRLVLKLLAGSEGHLFVTSDDDQCIRGPMQATEDRDGSIWSHRSAPEHIELATSVRPPEPIRRLASSFLGERRGETQSAIDDSPAVLIEAPSETDEARAIAQRIEWLCEENDFAYGDVAVLPRRLEELTFLETALREHGIPVQRPTTARYDDPVEDLLAYLQVAANPHDDRRMLRILNTPSRGIGPKTKDRLQRYARQAGLSLWDALNQVGEIETLTSRPRRSLRAFREMVAPFVERAVHEPGSSWARELVEQSGFLRAVTRGHTHEHLAREEQVEAILNRLESETSFDGGLATFLDHARLGGLRQSSPEHVTLSPVRAARGREFPIVFLPALEDGIFPRARTTARDVLLQNERRTFYVGLTRAQERLFLSWARSRSHGNTDEPTSRSRFLDELDAHLLQTDPPSRSVSRGPSDEIPSEYQQVDPHYYRNTLRAQQSNPQADPAPTADAADRIREGIRVEHETMGLGVVQRTAGEGNERIAIIDFDERGEKKIKLQYAPLTVIGDVSS